MQVRLGAWAKKEEDGAAEFVSAVRRYVLHEEYNQPSSLHDIALIELAQRVTRDACVRRSLVSAHE